MVSGKRAGVGEDQDSQDAVNQAADGAVNRGILGEEGLENGHAETDLPKQEQVGSVAQLQSFLTGSSLVEVQVPVQDASFAAAASAVTSLQIEVSYAFFPPIRPAEVALAIASSQGVNYQFFQPAEACYASCMGRGEGTGGIDVGSDYNRRSVSVGVSSAVEADPSNGLEGDGLLSDILSGGRELDVGMQQAREGEEGPRGWMQAVDLQVLGACREDECLHPLMRWNVSCLGSDGPLLTHLGQMQLFAGMDQRNLQIPPSMWQYFQQCELEQLARCLCAPLVSVRVGKVLRHGRTLQPTDTRGYLSLTMLPCSELRLSYVGDDGVLERLAVVSPSSEPVSLALEELPADSSGRTFVLKLHEGEIAYFWQSEKSKVVGAELIKKMKYLLNQQPTLAQLTGIQGSRLDSLASCVRSAYNVSVPAGATPQILASSLRRSEPVASLSMSADQRIPVCSPLHGHLDYVPGDITPQPGLRTSMAVPSVANFLTEQPWSAPTGGSLSSRFAPSVVTRPRCSDPVCSSGACVTSASSVSVGYSTSNLRSMLEVGSMQNSWSTRTSLWSNQESDVGQLTSHSAGLYTSVHPIPGSTGGDAFSWTPVSLETQSLPESFPLSVTPLPAFLSPPALSPCSIPPLVSASFPLSRSLLAPYYCPCPLGASALRYSVPPTHLPSVVQELPFVPSSTTPFSSVHPLESPSLSTFETERVNLSHQASLSPLLSGALSDPITRFPFFGLQIPTQNCLVREPFLGQPSNSPVLPVLTHEHHPSALSMVPSFSTSWQEAEQQANGDSTSGTLFVEGMPEPYSGAANIALGALEDEPGATTAVKSSGTSHRINIASERPSRTCVHLVDVGPRALSLVPSRTIGSTCGIVESQVITPCNRNNDVLRVMPEPFADPTPMYRTASKNNEPDVSD